MILKMITIFKYFKNQEKIIGYDSNSFFNFCKDCDMKSYFGDAWKNGEWVIMNNISIWKSGRWNLF